MQVLNIILAYFWVILPCCGVRWWPSYAGNVFLSACSCLPPFSPPLLLLLQSPNHSRLEMTTNPSAFRWLAQNTARLVPIFSNRSFTSGSQLHVYRTGRLFSGKNLVYDFLDKFSGCSLCVFGEWKKRCVYLGQVQSSDHITILRKNSRDSSMRTIKGISE